MINKPIQYVGDLAWAAARLVEGFCDGGFSDSKTNIIKLFEEVGELSQAAVKGTRQELIDEIADVLIVATAQGYFIGMTTAELTDALERKLQKGHKRIRALQKLEEVWDD